MHRANQKGEGICLRLRSFTCTSDSSTQNRYLVFPQVREVAVLLEEQLGLVRGWLLAVPCKVHISICRMHACMHARQSFCLQTGIVCLGCVGLLPYVLVDCCAHAGITSCSVGAAQVYLYIAASKRLVGCVMVQGITRAYRAVPHAEPAAASTADSAARPHATASSQLPPDDVSHIRRQEPHSPGACGQGTGPADRAQSCMPDCGTGTDAEQGAHGCSPAPAADAAPAAEYAEPAISASAPAACRSTHAQQQQPASAAAGRSRGAAVGPQGMGPRLKGQQTLLSSWLAGAQPGSRVQQEEVAEATPTGGGRETARDVAAPSASAAGCCSPRPSMQLLPAASDTGGSCTKSAPAAAIGKENVTAAAAAHADSPAFSAAADDGGGRRMRDEAEAAVRDVALSSSAACHPAQLHAAKKPCHGGMQGAAVARRAAGAAAQQQRRLEVDDSEPVQALAGVRVIWTSVEARRQGIASRLLDLARWASCAQMTHPLLLHLLLYYGPSQG